MKVSVIIPSYNHDKFIEAAIQSVLDQTFQDFEIIITDDGSSDKTVEKIQKFTDPRIKLFTFNENQGAYFALENCLKHATGQYIAMLSSDDLFLPNKLEKQVKVLDENNKYAAVFGFAQIIDETGNNRDDKEHFYSTVFMQENRTRHQWLKKFFYEGNFLCHPSVLIRKEFYTIDQFDPRYRQLPDFDFWIKLCMKSEIYVIQENLIKFRLLDAEMNTSGNTPENITRASFEYSKLLNSYLNLEAKDFAEIFGDKYGKPNAINSKLIPFFLSLEALEVNIPSHIEFAKNQLYTLLKDKNIVELLKKDYQFSINKYFNIIGDYNSLKKLTAEHNELIEVTNRKDRKIIELNTLAHNQQENIAILEEKIDTMTRSLNNLKEEIDISIVTYNSKKWMDSFFDSILKQAYPLNKLHIYVTDNSSTDDTYEYLKILEEKYSITFAGFNLQQTKNLGFGHGHNNNFKAGKSKFVLVTNVDLEFDDDSIENIVNFAVNDQKSTASWEFRQKPYEHPKYYNPVTLETTWSSSACVLFRKEAIDKVGGYDDHIFMYGEDVELSYRLRDYGYKLKYCPRAVCWHYTYAEANEIKEIQYFGSTLAHILIRMRYGTKAQLKEGLIGYKNLLNTQGLFINQRRKQLKYLLKLIIKAPYFLFNRKKNRDIAYKFINWDYEFIRDGAFYEYTSTKPTDNPLVSVIMRTCCERNEFLKEAIESVKNQTYSNIELIVVEDGTKNAQEIVENIPTHSIKNVIYIPIEKAGRVHAGNAGLDASNGRYIVFLDDDDLFFADHIEVLVQGMIDNPEIAACYTSSFEVPTEIISKVPFKYKEKSFSVYHREEFSRETMLHHNFIPIQSILFKRSLYEKYGGFDEDLDNLEDWNLWTRYSYLNDFKFIDKTTSLYRVPSCPDSSLTRQNELDRYYQIAIKKQQEFILAITNKDT